MAGSRSHSKLGMKLRSESWYVKSTRRNDRTSLDAFSAEIGFSKSLSTLLWANWHASIAEVPGFYNKGSKDFALQVQQLNLCSQPKLCLERL